MQNLYIYLHIIGGVGRIRELIGNHIFQSVIATILAIVIRSIPAWTYKAWGDDFGIYYGLTNSFIETQKLFPNYTGWGNSYQYFPMIYLVTVVAHYLTGLDVSFLLPKIAPIFGGLTILVFYYVVRTVTKNNYIAFFAALFLAINPVHIFQTSKPYPLTMGHFFFMLLMYLYVKSFKDKWAYYALFFGAIALVMSHHLTTYMFIVSFTGILFIEGILGRLNKNRLRENIIFAIYFTVLAFSYWIFIATPVSSWIYNNLKIDAYLVMLILIAFHISMYLIIQKKGEVLRVKIDRILSWGSGLPDTYLFLFSAFFSSVVLILVGIYGVGVVNISLNPLLLIQASPTIATIGFGVLGLKYAKKYPTFFGWFLGIFVSLSYAAVTWSRTLYPERHLEYIFEAFSVFSAVGVYIILKRNKKYIYHPIVSFREKITSIGEFWHSPTVMYSPHIEGFRVSGLGTAIPQKVVSRPTIEIKTKKIKINYKKLLPAIVVILILSSPVLSYPGSIENYYPEGISYADWDAINFIVGNLSRNYTVATDHRLGIILNSTYGFYATFDKAIKIWIEEDWRNFIDELEGNNSTYPRIGYILIDNFMVNGSIVLIDNGPHGATIIIKDWYYEKFRKEPFELIYRATSDDSRYWAEVYKVNWTYIQENAYKMQ